MANTENLHRAARLSELIDTCFDGSIEVLRKHIKLRKNEIVNQGELSGLKAGKKSFGYKKAGTLAEQIGLSRNWFEMPLGSNLAKEEWMDDAIHYKLNAETVNYNVQEAVEILNRLEESDQIELLHWLRVEEVRRRDKGDK